MAERKSKISNVEWGLVIGLLFTLDGVQILIEWLLGWVFGIGVVINIFLDMLIAMSFAFYLQMRGESLADKKRIFSLVATFGLEMIPILDELPLWGLEGIFAFFISRSGEIQSKFLSNIPIVGRYIGGKQNQRANNPEQDTE